MGMSYTIDRERRLVRSRGWGVVSSRDLQELTSRILADRAFDSALRSLADLSEVTAVAVDMMVMAETAWMPLYVPGTRRAIVATGDVVYGLARTFASIAVQAGHDVRVFREMREAEAWLEA